MSFRHNMSEPAKILKIWEDKVFLSRALPNITSGPEVWQISFPDARLLKIKQKNPKNVFWSYVPLSFFTFFIIWWVYVDGSWQSIYQINAWDQYNTVFIIKLCWNCCDVITWRHKFRNLGLICYIIMGTACYPHVTAKQFIET